MKRKPIVVLVSDRNGLGIPGGVYDCLPCPEEYKDKYDDEIWIWSDRHNEPARIFSHEILSIDYED